VAVAVAVGVGVGVEPPVIVKSESEISKKMLSTASTFTRGTGIFLMRVHIPSGRVTQVIVGRGTGHKMLDAAAVKTLLS
jgi:hypothetical protein